MKTKAKILLLIISLSSSTLMGSASDNMFSKEIPLVAFHKLIADGNMRIVFVNNDDGTIRIQGSSASVTSVSIAQTSGVLTILKDESISDMPVTVYVPVSEMNTIIISGDAAVECETVIHADILSLLHKGTGVVKLKSDANVIQTMATRSGRIAVDGEYKNIVSHKDGSNHLIVAYTK